MNDIYCNVMHDIEVNQKEFYIEKYRRFGDDPRSLSWNDKKSQYLRFEKISELFKYEKDNLFTLHEVGCGLAHFKAFLDEKQWNVKYSGSDIVEEFIRDDQRKYPQCSFFIENISKDPESINEEIKGLDYYCLNGTFHTKGKNSIVEWESFVYKSITNMFLFAKKGICINFLTTQSDYFDKDLYYANPSQILNWCFNNCSRFVSINHEIPLYEYFVYIYKEEFLRIIYPQYSRYFSVKK